VKSSVRTLLFFTVFVGCTASPPRESPVVRLAMWGPLGQLTPRQDEPSLAQIAAPWVFEKLVSVDTAWNLRPVLAAAVTRVGGDRLRVELRRDATFSDGVPVREDDVIRSLRTAGLRVIADDGALIVESREPAIPTDVLLIRVYVHRESGGALVGSGPFMLAAQNDTELRLVRRTPLSGRINEVRILAYPTARDAFAHTLKGDANAIVDLDPRWLEFFRGVPTLQVVHGTGRSTDSIMFNLRIPRDERIQLVAALASERVRELAYGGMECAESKTPGESEVTAGSGPPLRVLAWGPLERLALAARRTLGERGGEISTVAPQDALARLKQRDFDLVTARPIMWPPSALSLNWRTGSPANFTGYSNPALDDALDGKDWVGAEKALREDPPAAFVCTREQLAVLDARIKNPMLGPYEPLETLPDWEIAQ
jgi:hypothetical protein